MLFDTANQLHGLVSQVGYVIRNLPEQERHAYIKETKNALKDGRSPASSTALTDEHRSVVETVLEILEQTVTSN